MNYAVMAAGKTSAPKPDIAQQAKKASNADPINPRTASIVIINQGYTLNKREALSKKLTACDRILPIRSEKKRGGHVFYMQPAYYEIIKSLFIDTDFLYTAPSFSVDNFDEHQEKGENLSVSYIFKLAKTGTKKRYCSVCLYNTTSTMMVNGPSTDEFVTIFLPQAHQKARTKLLEKGYSLEDLNDYMRSYLSTASRRLDGDEVSTIQEPARQIHAPSQPPATLASQPRIQDSTSTVLHIQPSSVIQQSTSTADTPSSSSALLPHTATESAGSLTSTAPSPQIVVTSTDPAHNHASSSPATSILVTPSSSAPQITALPPDTVSTLPVSLDQPPIVPATTQPRSDTPVTPSAPTQLSGADGVADDSSSHHIVSQTAAAKPKTAKAPPRRTKQPSPDFEMEFVRNQNTILQTRNLQLEGENKHLRDLNESLKAELSSLLADKRTPDAPPQEKQGSLADHQLLDVHLQIARLDAENAKNLQRQSEHIIEIFKRISPPAENHQLPKPTQTPTPTYPLVFTQQDTNQHFPGLHGTLNHAPVRVQLQPQGYTTFPAYPPQQYQTTLNPLPSYPRYHQYTYPPPPRQTHHRSQAPVPASRHLRKQPLHSPQHVGIQAKANTTSAPPTQVDSALTQDPPVTTATTPQVASQQDSPIAFPSASRTPFETVHRTPRSRSEVNPTNLPRPVPPN